MPKELRFPASKAKAFLLLVGSALFVAMGYFILPKHPVAGWLCMLFFSLGIPVAIWTLFSDKTYLRLTPEGFEMASPFKTALVPWRNVAGFGIGTIRNVKMIAVMYRPEHGAQQTMRKLSSSLTGMEGAIPNSYAISLDKLLAHLNEWHARFGAR